MRRLQKPVDTPYGRYTDSFPAEGTYLAHLPSSGQMRRSWPPKLKQRTLESLTAAPTSTNSVAVTGGSLVDGTIAVPLHEWVRDFLGERDSGS